MKINSFPQTTNREKYPDISFKSIPANPKCVPEIFAKIAKVTGEYVRTPEQRLILAFTALLFQPLIDLKFAHEDKKVDSAIKSASKAIVCGFTGVTIRSLFIMLTSKCIGAGKNNILNRDFLPDKAQKLFELKPLEGIIRMREYNNTLGSIFAILFMMLFSNSKIDGPLVSDMQDLLSGVIKEKKGWLESINCVKESRCRKIRIWLNRRKDFILRQYEKLKKIVKIIKEDNPAKKTGGNS